MFNFINLPIGCTKYKHCTIHPTALVNPQHCERCAFLTLEVGSVSFSKCAQLCQKTKEKLIFHYRK